MERIEDLCHPGAPSAGYTDIKVSGQTYGQIWLPALPIQPTFLMSRLRDAWAVWKGRAAAVQWPHQR